MLKILVTDMISEKYVCSLSARVGVKFHVEGGPHPLSIFCRGSWSRVFEHGHGEGSRSSSHWHDWLSRNLSAHRYDLITDLIKFIDRQQLQQRVAIIWDIFWKGVGVVANPIFFMNMIYAVLSFQGNQELLLLYYNYLLGN